MSVRVIHHGRDLPNNQPEMTDPVSIETTVDGQTFAWMPGQVRNFLDDGVGAAHAAYDGEEDKTIEDSIPFGQSRS